MQQQSLRKPRMQSRWGQLGSELNLIQQAHEVPVQSLRLSVSFYMFVFEGGNLYSNDI